MLNDNNPINLVVVLGPTASGKTRLGVGIARSIGGEIISADSRQVFRCMDIGTGKDIADYGDLPYHLIDIRDPSEEFSVFHFQRECLQAMADIRTRSRVPVLVGGTGLYIESILNGYQLVEVPENQALRVELAGVSLDSLCSRLVRTASSTHNTTDMLDRERLIRAIEIAEHAQLNEPEPLPEIRPLIFGIRWERSTLRKRITARLKERLAGGMVEEVKKLHDTGVPWERLDYFGLEYRFVARHLRGELNRNDMMQKLNSAIHDFAKRQDNWFRRMERNGTIINWLEGEADPVAQALAVLEQSRLVTHVL